MPEFQKIRFGEGRGGGSRGEEGRHHTCFLHTVWALKSQQASTQYVVSTSSLALNTKLLIVGLKITKEKKIQVKKKSKGRKERRKDQKKDKICHLARQNPPPPLLCA